MQIVLLSGRYSSGAHYITVQYRDGLFHVWNEGRISEPIESIEAWLDMDDQASFTPWSLMTINDPVGEHFRGRETGGAE